MSERKNRLLSQTNFIFIGMACGVVLLSAESLILRQNIFLNYALGLAAVGLILITIILWIITKFEE